MIINDTNMLQTTQYVPQSAQWSIVPKIETFQVKNKTILSAPFFYWHTYKIVKNPWGHELSKYIEKCI